MVITGKHLGIRAAALLMLLAGAGGCATAREWITPDREEADPRSSRAAVEAQKEMERGAGKYVVVDLEVNELRFMDGDRALWSAPVGTGTGLRLLGESKEWDFSTPRGVFQVQFKEEDPVWVLPDWYFVKNKMPIPPEDSPKRRVPGALGAAAVYLGDEIAIHGTDKPELLGQRVSHGCIRLADEYAKRLFHNVQIGTPVLVVGGERAVRRAANDNAAVPTNPPGPANPGPTRPRPVDPATRLTTERLLQRLDTQIKAADTTSKWTGTASILIARGLKDDSLALRGLLRRAGRTDNEAFEREYATFIADAFARGSLRAVVSLARIDSASRNRAAAAIVQATMDLFHGSLDDPAAPWPTRRVPLWRLGPEGSNGWKALEAAEKVYRTQGGNAQVVLRERR
jgi:hypothetical protein